jgi:hypothetical protein
MFHIQYMYKKYIDKIDKDISYFQDLKEKF